MKDREFLQVQVLQLRELLDAADGDPVLTRQLRPRLAQAESRLQEAEHEGTEWAALPRAAIFLRGGGVFDSGGIRSSLAGEALIQYERMFTQQALHDEREAAKEAGRRRRRPGTPRPALLFTGTLRGSFGFEFVPHTEDPSLVEMHSASLRKVANALVSVAESKSLEKAVTEVPPGVLQPLKQFMTVLAKNDAELRLAFPDEASRIISAIELKGAAQLLEKEVSVDIVEIDGIFRGLTRDSGVFDLRTDDSEVTTGSLGDELTEEDLDRISSLTNKPCRAILQMTVITGIAGAKTSRTAVLLDAKPIESQSPPTH